MRTIEKTIRLSAHAASYIPKRGFTVEEVEETIRTSEWEPAELRRVQSKKNFPFHNLWNGHYYETKQVHPIFVEEDEIIVITVLTYYF
ncbi:MAG: hypothetical protein EPO24_04715 [Bacteroidetes bacterium]|nr:MAG: hypothetical protein EPO24_04715 [Bacteroidota bacterium]